MSTYRYADHPVPDRSELVKIRIPLNCSDPRCGEWVWASPLGGDTYRIENVVFNDSNVGLHDEVLALDLGDSIEVVDVLLRRTHVRFVFHLPNHHRTQVMDDLPFRDDVAIEGNGRGVFSAHLPDRTVATEFQSFLESHATWFERIDGVLTASNWDR